MKGVRIATAAAAVLFAVGPAPEVRAAEGGVRYEAELRQGDLAFGEGRFPAAVRAYRRAVALAPSASAPRYRLALVEYLWGDAVPGRRDVSWSAALDTLGELLWRNPFHVGARRLKALIHLRRGETELALEEMRRLTEEVRLTDPAVWNDLADAARAAGEGALAERAEGEARLLREGMPAAGTRRLRN